LRKSGDYKVEIGQKIAQLLIQKIEFPPVKEVQNLEDLGGTVRGDKGFGSTGV
jgi:dUTP pyrophosphatase